MLDLLTRLFSLNLDSFVAELDQVVVSVYGQI